MLVGLEARRIEVQADSGNGEPKFSLVGLAATSVKEARERVRSAIKNSGLEFPPRRLTVNLAPAELRKQGSGLDLAIAVAIALARAGLKAPPGSAFLGELALDGAVRHVDGVLVAARGMRRLGYERVFVPAVDAPEAALVEGMEVIPCPDLASVVAHLVGARPIPPHGAVEVPSEPWSDSQEHDLAEVHGQEEAKRALEVAAAGGHHLLMSGPPGAGKTMLARCLAGILPPLDLAEALDVAEVRSLLGELATGRPLRLATALPRAPPQRLDGWPRRRRPGVGAAGRDQPRAPWRAVPGRAGRVPGSCPPGPPAAARDRVASSLTRVRAARSPTRPRFHARRRDQPMPMRLGRRPPRPCRCTPGRDRRLPARGCQGRSWTGSTSRSPSGPLPLETLASEPRRRAHRRRCAARSSPPGAGSSSGRGASTPCSDPRASGSSAAWRPVPGRTPRAVGGAARAHRPWVP